MTKYCPRCKEIKSVVKVNFPTIQGKGFFISCGDCYWFLESGEIKE